MDLSTFFSVTTICRYKNRYLLVKISHRHKYCPGDWDFLATRIESSRKSAEKIAYDYTFKYTGLEGKIVKKGSVFEFPDKESSANWVICPFIMAVKNKDVKLKKKYTDYKWVKLRDILKYDRLNYLKAYLRAMNLI
ncbi:unnamed protein product [marine sediment metagenome]|uniref:Nudix hydrolase domain-containing protein n=1 Tax=marine sediment metagenome TaxID=412755 RepID=X1TFA5_9ZZZZ